MKRDGLSPRVRGNRSYGWSRSGPDGSIPACTGEPTTTRISAVCHTVYPRVYGGTMNARYSWRASCGLSPRVRGNPRNQATRRASVGSIPACTGEPTSSAPTPVDGRVYPRVYGGTRPLSPFRNGVTVYPRVYGGTLTFMPRSGARLGLSPRVRGNLEGGPCRPCISRSIPACTGEPLLILLHFLPLRACCALQRDAIQIVKELFVLGRAGPFRENDALLIHQLNRRRSKDSNDLSARMT